MIVIDNVFGPGVLEAIQQTARSHHYEPLITGEQESIFVSGCPRFFEKTLNSKLEEELGEFTTVVSYFRMNSEDVDNHMRVHSDRDIQGKTPTHGVVFYVDIEEGGTGFYDHKVYGDRLPEGVCQPEEEYGDEDLWTFREYLEGKPNRMVAYPSNMFHMRHPIRTTGERLVWVSFIQIK